MHFISHRGARSMGSDNSLDAIQKASTLAVAYIEFDFQYTKNNICILYHDTHTPSGKDISKYTYKTLQRELPDIATLDEALRTCNDTPALIESKRKGSIARALQTLKLYPTTAIASFIADEILAARIQAPGHTTFLLQHMHPFGIVKKALSINSHGIGLNKNWLVLFPYYYLQCRKHSLKMYCYTVNNALLVSIIRKLFPAMLICTDIPAKYVDRSAA